jgi:ABC-type antimicrobial peptide transport system permease subunit
VPDVRITGHFLIRTHGPAETAIPDIRSAANRDAPEQPVVSVMTLAATEAGQRRNVMRAIAASGGSGVVAVLLSAIGLYAVVAFAVGQRVREIGIRTALGAGHEQVVGMFLIRGLRLSLVGLVCGVPLSALVFRLVTVAGGDERPMAMPAVAALVASIVIGVAVLASWIPARRAARVDPLLALRSD